MLMLIEQLQATELVPSSEPTRKLCSEVERELHFDVAGQQLQAIAIIGSISVSGHTIKRATPLGKKKKVTIAVPLFAYPKELVISSEKGQHGTHEQHVRAFDWQSKFSIDDVEDWGQLQSQVRFTRKGNTEDVVRKLDTSIVFHCVQKPADAYAVWQRHALLDIGHFSYGPHHYYVWIDLRKHILDRGPESVEMIDRMLEKLGGWAPQWIFYEPHEATETLVDRLCEESEAKGMNVVSRNRTWPISQVQTFASIYSNSCEDGDSDGLITAVFLDDAMISGNEWH